MISIKSFRKILD